MQFQKTALALCAAGLLSLPGLVAASGGPSGPAVTFAVQGNIGEVIVNPYKLAPLTAIIRNGGYELQDVEVRIVPKQNGQEIKYKVSKRKLKNSLKAISSMHRPFSHCPMACLHKKARCFKLKLSR